MSFWPIVIRHFSYVPPSLPTSMLDFYHKKAIIKVRIEMATAGEMVEI